MATLYVAEFADVSFPQGNLLPVANVPPVAEQIVSISGSSTPCTNAFASKTQYVQITTDAICSIAFGTAPTATTSNMRLPANMTIYFGVPKGQSYKVAVITNT